MNWLDIIKQIMALVGPLLSELIKKWLEGLLNKSTKVLPDPSDSVQAKADVLEEALSKTPRRQVLRRALLRHLLEVVPDAGTKLAKADATEIKALGQLADQE